MRLNDLDESMSERVLTTFGKLYHPVSSADHSTVRCVASDALVLLLLALIDYLSLLGLYEI